ncbi:hypothetical protein CEXT_55001 [Caerostris extrusa]|uniref:Uncharacterized protein n=1 Tax=Caerostris extrusa TaxID=172846 RepID=A0AAV4RHY3_CAEEX|nr:hypothetical protein CEXT_55001 [Caerostris extrusa]
MRKPKNYSPLLKTSWSRKGSIFSVAPSSKGSRVTSLATSDEEAMLLFFFFLHVQPCFWYLRHSPLGCASCSNFFTLSKKRVLVQEHFDTRVNTPNLGEAPVFELFMFCDSGILNTFLFAELVAP